MSYRHEDVNDFGQAINVIREVDLSSRTEQTVGMYRRAGIDGESTGARKIWMGRVSADPGMVSDPHHHAEAETAGYVLSGLARIYYGVRYSKYVEVGPGEMIFVPSDLAHIEVNPSRSETLEFLTTRSPDNIVVNLDDLPEGWTPFE